MHEQVVVLLEGNQVDAMPSFPITSNLEWSHVQSID
jgi:hypothetical protein